MKTGSQATRSGARLRRLLSRRAQTAALGWLLAGAGLLAALGRLPLIRNPVDVSPDGCEYLGIARHLAVTGQWVSSLKWNFFTAAPVIHPALADRPPLFPLWAAGWVALAAQPEQQIWLARLSNLLLAAAIPAVIFWCLRIAVTDAAAALAAFIFMFYPGFLRNSAQPLTEPLFLLLLFGSLGRFLRAAASGDWLLSGLLAGLSFLARSSGILLPILYCAAMAGKVQGSRVSGEGDTLARRASLPPLPSLRWRPLGWVLLGFILPLLPYWIGVAAQTGSPFTSILRYNYSIRHIDEGTFYGFERSFEPPARFVWHHAWVVAGLIAQQWRTMAWALGRSLLYLLPLAFFWRPRWGWKRNVLLGFACLNFLLHAMSWAIWGAARYLFPTYIIGMALLLDAPQRWANQRADAEEKKRGNERTTAHRALAAGATGIAVALTLIACLQQDAHLYHEKAEPYAGVHLGWAYAEAGRQLARTPPGTVCAANQPWIINLLARRPAVIAPWFHDAGQLHRFVARYQPATLTLFVTAREPHDVTTALRLVNNLWTQPKLRPEVADVLTLEAADIRSPHAVRQALLIFRVRPRGEADGR